MSTKKKFYIIFTLIFILFIIPLTITIFIFNYHFGKRVVHENNYFTHLNELNPNFIKNEISFPSNNGQILRGAFYSQSDNTSPKGLLIMIHGHKVNHDNYLAEIEWLTKENYVVLSYDNTGVSMSDGDSLKGLTQGPIDLSYALSYLYNSQQYSDIPHILIGHSWGGFSVSSVYALDNVAYEVDGIISLAGFWRNINIIEDIAKIYTGNIIELLRPYLILYEKVLFAENSNIDGIKGLSNINVPVLLIHSKDDQITRFDSNYLVYYNLFQDNSRFTFQEYEDAGHKLTVTQESYDRIHDIMHHQMDLAITDPHYQELEDERLDLISELNLDVMNDILNFCNDITNAQ